MKKRNKVLLSVLAIIVCMLFGCERKEAVILEEFTADAAGEAVGMTGEKVLADTETDWLSAEEGDAVQGKQPLEQDIIVHICGAVKKPGVYTLEAGSRVYQAVEKAGGFCSEGAQDFLNQADLLQDGMKLYVPTQEEVSQALEEGNGREIFWAAEERTEQASGLVNINTATEEELCTLTGIGSNKAKSIIAYREKNGKYQKIEDIMLVEGIKSGMFQKIKDSITV